jgi:hypothetical protein
LLELGQQEQPFKPAHWQVKKVGSLNQNETRKQHGLHGMFLLGAMQKIRVFLKKCGLGVLFSEVKILG